VPPTSEAHTVYFYQVLDQQQFAVCVCSVFILVVDSQSSSVDKGQFQLRTVLLVLVTKQHLKTPRLTQPSIHREQGTCWPAEQPPCNSSKRICSEGLLFRKRSKML